MCESRGGRPGLPSLKAYGFCGRKATLNSTGRSPEQSPWRRQEKQTVSLRYCNPGRKEGGLSVHRMLYPVPPLASIQGSGANCRAEGQRGDPAGSSLLLLPPAPHPHTPHPPPPSSPPLALGSVFEPQVHQQSITGPLPSSAALYVGGSRHSGWRWNVDQIKTTWTSSGCVSACVLLFALMHLFVCWSARLLAFTFRAKSQPARLSE